MFRAHFLKKYKKRISILTKSEINCIKLPLLILLSKSAFAIGLKECKWNLFRILVTTVDIPVASDNPVHYADAIRYNARTPLQGSLLPLTRLV